MRVTNKHNIPGPLLKSLTKNRPVIPGEVHVTTLIGPSLPYYLRKEHWDELEEDASQRMFAIMGTAMHAVISGNAQVDYAMMVLGDLIEFWLDYDHSVALDVVKDLLKFLAKGGDGIETHLEWQYNDKWKIVGTDDHHNEDDRVIMDWKYISVWSYLFADHNWEEQLNVYTWLRRKLGYTVEKLEVWALIRDWKKYEAMKDPKYPAIPFVRVPLRLWSEEEADEYVAKRIALFSKKPVECTPREKWQTDDVFKVMKQGRKSALIATRWQGDKKVPFLSVSEAQHAATKHKKKKNGKSIPDPIKVDGAKFYIEKTEGECKRCKDYCSANKFCPYYKEED